MPDTSNTNHDNIAKSPEPAQSDPDTGLIDWGDDEIVRTEIPNRKRSGFDRASFVAELKKNGSDEPGKFVMGISKSKPTSEFGKHSRVRKKSSPSQQKEPLPHSHIRGVHHGSPLKVYVGAMITVLFYFSIILTFVEIILVGLTFKIGIEDFVILAFLLLMTILFCTAARSCCCSICKAHFFGSGKFNRHSRAHHLPFLGKNFSTALHALTLFWLRCPACGTPTRLIGKKNR